MFVCQHSNVQTLSSPPVLKLWNTQGYLWLPYDLAEVIKLIGVTSKQKRFFSKKYFISFLPNHCHSFRIIVIHFLRLSLSFLKSASSSSCNCRSPRKLADEKKLRKIPMIFDIENWLWKSNFGTFWHLPIVPILKIQ